MPQEEKLFDMDPDAKPPADNLGIDRDYFTPGAEVPPSKEPSPFQPPKEIRGEPTEEEADKIDRLTDQGFGPIQAEKKVLGDRFIDPGLPPGVDNPPRARVINQDRRKLSAQGKLAADEPTPQHEREHDAQNREGEAAIFNLPPEARLEGAAEARRILGNLKSDQTTATPGEKPVE